jgi:hypothetical protein
MANTHGEKELKRNWPVVTGLTATSKHEGRVTNLIPQGLLGIKSTVLSKYRVGLDNE